MQTVFGWWVLDPDGPMMVNRISGQRLRFEGPATGHETFLPNNRRAEEWLRFSYHDSAVRYPLLAHRKRSAEADVLTGPWHVDHVASAALWRHEFQGSSEYPAYGLWRRVDDCLVDAFVNWPELELTGHAAKSVIALGGWVNGTWSANLERIVRCDASFRMGAEDRQFQDVILERLDALPPLTWTYVDADEVDRSVGLANIEKRRDGRLDLPAVALVTGLDGHVPYLRRADGLAVIFPASVTGRLTGPDGGYYSASLSVAYVDGDVVIIVSGSTGDTFHFHTALTWEFGLRRSDSAHTEGPEGTSLVQVMQTAPHRPSPVLLRRLATAFVDGWLQWDGGDKRFLDDIHYIARERQRSINGSVPTWEDSGCPLARPGRVVVDHSYSGGVLSSPISCDARIVTDAQLEREAQLEQNLQAYQDRIRRNRGIDSNRFDVRALLHRQWQTSIPGKLFRWVFQSQK